MCKKLINGDKGQLTDWSQVNWGKARKVVKNLRQRIFRARKLGKWKQLRRLQKLLLKSRANLLLSVRQITQVNKGKETAGIDREVVNTPAKRVELANTWKMPSVAPTKRVYIPKKNGKKRPLGIPTVRDRVAQAIVKNTLEPEWEAVFEPNSYGFRGGRNCQDAIAQCYIGLRKGCETWVLDADIKGFFDNIDHQIILKAVGSHPSLYLINNWVKAGYIDKDGSYNPTYTGTPQGGVISPLLANIGLHGLEDYINNLKVVKKVNRGKPKKDGTYTQTEMNVKLKLGLIRYADDFVITAKSKEDLKTAIDPIKRWLSERNLELSEEKTRIVHIEKGFDFLSFNIRQYNGTLLIKPQKSEVLEFCKKIGEVCQEYSSVEQDTLIRKLNPILRGFANYYRGVVSKETFSYIGHRVHKYLWKWAVRRHPQKGKKWIYERYFHVRTYRDENGKSYTDKWCFECQVADRFKKPKLIELFRIKYVPIIRHVKVKGCNSPDDSSLNEYWAKRHTEYGNKQFARHSKMWKVAENQEWKCPVCGDYLFNGEELHTHHIVPVSQGGGDSISNLVHLHSVCHKQVHSKSKNPSLRA